jgi:hypothetical protein
LGSFFKIKGVANILELLSSSGKVICILILAINGFGYSLGNFFTHSFASRDRYYDLLNIFAKKISKKIAFLTQNKAKICKILIITLAFEKNANYLPKIVENRRKL